jgi:hypothetical protein
MTGETDTNINEIKQVKDRNKQNLRGSQRTGGVAQAVDYLLCKPEALSSDPIPTKEKASTK